MFYNVPYARNQKGGARIVRAMEENPVLRAKTAARTRYSTRWVAEHQLLPLLDSF